MNRFNQILIELLYEVQTWSNLKTGLENYNTVKTKTTTKKTIAGNIFEYFAKYYFLIEPTQTDLYKNVWLYNEIPLSISEKLKLPPVDHGIDILLQDIDNNYFAVQCKFKNDELKTLSWSGDKIANVFALGTLCEKIMVFTNASDVAKVAKNFESKYSQITNAELLNIESDIFENILRLALGQQPIELEKYKPREHQKIAISKVVKHFETNERGQLILPCGAGKTLTALWIKEELKYKTTLVLLPSLALLKQIKNDWARHKNSSYRYMCVCSEKDIDKDQFDSVAVHTYEIGGPVSTEPKVVNDFIKKSGDKIIFSTYQSLKVIRDACISLSDFSFDITICDEAHRTAGSKNKNVFTLVHDNNQIPSKKRLYMTATPKVVSTKLKTKLGEDYDLLCDMSNPNVFGDEAFRMSFGEAINKGILVNYKIIGIGVTDKDVKRFIEERNYIGDISIDELAHNFALNMVMSKYKAFHGLSFHSRVIYAKDFAKRHKDFFEEIFSKHVEGKQSTTYRTKVLHDFKNSEKGIVSNARCLTEGVDVPTIDLIYFCDPKSSKIDIVQASGRALRTDSTGKKEMGYIVVPIFHYITENIEAEIKRKPIFHHLIQVVRSLCDQDERLQAEINQLAFKKGKRNNSKIEIVFSDDETEKIIKLEGLEKKLKHVLFDEIIEKNKDTWEVMFMRLTDFIVKNGHMNVSKSEDKKLQNWIYERRRRNRDGTLDSTQKKRLDAIGFDWKNEQFREQSDLDEIWWGSYVKLIDYFKKHGHSNVPARYKKDKPLGTWVVQQRVAKRMNNISSGREDLLEELKFDWNPQIRIFEEFCERLILYKEKYGHTEVPTHDKEFPKLGKWTNTYRVILNNGTHNDDGSITYNNRSLSKEQIERLQELGFKSSVRIISWESFYNQLKSFYNENGHSKPRQDDSYGLYSWCYRIRKKIRPITDEQKKLLEELDFDFTLDFKFSKKGSRQNWDERIVELQLFFEENKHFDITLQNEEFDGLYKWLVYHRRQYKNDNLSESKISDLKNIGFDFNIHFQPQNTGDAVWDDRLAELKEYFEIKGTFYIPSNNEEYKSLLSWLRYQKRLYREGKLSQENVEKLIDLGYSFDTTYRGVSNSSKSRGYDSWIEKFKELKQYYSEYNTFLIPNHLQEYSSLQSWVRYQRKQFKDKKLDKIREEKLKSIDFSFESDFRGRKIDYSDEVKLEQKLEKTQRNSWEENYLRLLDYKIEFGDCNVPKSYKDKSLSYFVIRQRHNFRTNKLTDVQIKKLELLGLKWEVERPISTTAWDSKFKHLKEFFIKNGHSHYKKTDGDESLYHWVLRQRMDYKKEKLVTEKIQLLDSIDFIWNASSMPILNRPDNDKWKSMYNKLILFKDTNGHCLVPQIYKPDKSFGRWVNDQRNNKKKGKLLEEREKLLNEIDFVWDKKEHEWNLRLELLKEFHHKFGHFEVKQSDKGFESLYYWLYKIRKDGTTSDKKEKLESIGYEFVEYNPENWFEMFTKLAKHKETTGSFDFSDSENEINNWLVNQKILIGRSELPKDKIEILTAIGVNNQPKSKPRKKHKRNTSDWFEMLDILKEYHGINGDFNVPKKYPMNQALSNWLYYQKTLRRTNKLEQEKIEAFEKLGFKFPEPIQNQKSWDERFEELLDYKKKYGDCKVPVRFKENQQLATWVRTQRRNYKENTIVAEKKDKLEKNGFIWRALD